MVGTFSTPHLMSIKFYLGLLDFQLCSRSGPTGIENAARISSRMSRHGLSGAKPGTFSPRWHASWVSLCSIQTTECFIRLEKRTPGAAEVGSCLTDATRGDGSRRPFVMSHCAEARTHAPAVNVA